MERAVSFSRAPIIVGQLGRAYGLAGCKDDAARLLRELHERAGRGEYIDATAFLAIYVGQRDLPGTREALSKSLAQGAPPISVTLFGGHILESLRSDPEIDRLHLELLGW